MAVLDDQIKKYDAALKQLIESLSVHLTKEQVKEISAHYTSAAMLPVILGRGEGEHDQLKRWVDQVRSTVRQLYARNLQGLRQGMEADTRGQAALAQYFASLKHFNASINAMFEELRSNLPNLGMSREKRKTFEENLAPISVIENEVTRMDKKMQDAMDKIQEVDMDKIVKYLDALKQKVAQFDALFLQSKNQGIVLTDESIERHVEGILSEVRKLKNENMDGQSFKELKAELKKTALIAIDAHAEVLFKGVQVNTEKFKEMMRRIREENQQAVSRASVGKQGMFSDHTREQSPSTSPSVKSKSTLK